MTYVEFFKVIKENCLFLRANARVDVDYSQGAQHAVQYYENVKYCLTS